MADCAANIECATSTVGLLVLSCSSLIGLPPCPVFRMNSMLPCMLISPSPLMVSLLWTLWTPWSLLWTLSVHLPSLVSCPVPHPSLLLIVYIGLTVSCILRGSWNAWYGHLVSNCPYCAFQDPHEMHDVHTILCMSFYPVFPSLFIAPSFESF